MSAPDLLEQWRRAPSSARAPISKHGTPEYRRLLNQMVRESGATLTCHQCGWQAKTLDVAKYERRFSEASKEKEENGALVTPISSRLFHVHHLDYDHGRNTSSNLVLLCSVCHHVQHVALDGLDDRGHLVLLGGMSQAELIVLWRTLSVTHLIQPATEIGLRALTLLERMSADGTKHLQDATRAPPEWNLSPSAYRYWLSNTSEASHRVIDTLIPDLRFLPSTEEFIDHLSFVEEFQGEEFFERMPAPLTEMP